MDTSLVEFADRHSVDGGATEELLSDVASAVESASDLKIWRAVDLDPLRARILSPFTPPPFARQAIPELWDMPFAAKDVFNSSFFGVEKGSDEWAGYRAGNDARVIVHAERRGAVLIGMTSTSEFAVDKESPTLNPHGFDRTPGTSSAGSAVASALGLVSFALGTQAAGSITRPASFSGTIGMKPSFGVIPRTGVLKTSDSLDTVGFFVPRVDSLRAVLTALRVAGPDYPNIHRFVDPVSAIQTSADSLRIAFIQPPWWCECSSDVREMYDDLVRQITSVGSEVVEVDMSSATEGAHLLHDTIYNASLTYHLSEDFDAAPENFSPVLHARMEAGRSVDRQHYLDALRLQERLSFKVSRQLETIDIAMTIATASCAPHRGEEPLVDPSLIWTLAGIPTVCVPMGIGTDGMPIGVQFIAAKYRDYQLIAALEVLARCGAIVDRSLPIKLR